MDNYWSDLALSGSISIGILKLFIIQCEVLYSNSDILQIPKVLLVRWQNLDIRPYGYFLYLLSIIYLWNQISLFSLVMVTNRLPQTWFSCHNRKTKSKTMKANELMNSTDECRKKQIYSHNINSSLACTGLLPLLPKHKSRMHQNVSLCRLLSYTGAQGGSGGWKWGFRPSIPP